MATAIEIKYFNSYIIKKIKSIQPVKNYATKYSDGYTFEFNSGDNYFKFTPEAPFSMLDFVGSGQKLTFTYPLTGSPDVHIYTIIGWEAFGANQYKIYINKNLINTFTSSPSDIPNYVPIHFGNIVDFNYIPGSHRYSVSDTEDWYIEESRIRGGYNNTSTDYGVKAYIVEENAHRQRRISSLIYSGIYNSKNGVNNTNQFSVAEDITRTLNPAQGSIQKLYAEDTNLIIFQELKVSRALIDKDAIYTAEGQPITASSSLVIGEVQAYSGNYGISKNPESFAVYGYRKYFTDKNKNLVLRLSQDGITEISALGMVDYFRDYFSGISKDGAINGSWDAHNKLYVLSMKLTNKIFAPGTKQDNILIAKTSTTLCFDEDYLGWTNRFSFIPHVGFSLRGDFYTSHNGNVWKHYSTKVPYCNYYGNQFFSTVAIVLNIEQSTSKNFQTVNYEGTPGWALTAINTDSDAGIPILSSTMPNSLFALESELFTNNFKVKENKNFGTILNNSKISDGEIIFGQSASGVKGFYMVGEFSFPDPYLNIVDNYKSAILFAISSTFTLSEN